jgi:hypothetical protein
MPVVDLGEVRALEVGSVEACAGEAGLRAAATRPRGIGLGGAS